METSLPDNIRFTRQALRQKKKSNDKCVRKPRFSNETQVIYENIHAVLVLGTSQACDCLSLFIHSNL